MDRYKPFMGSSEGRTNEFWDFRESYSLGFYIPTPFIFGLPERVDTFKLKPTEGQGEPIRLQALDIFPHDTYAREGVYSSIPYLTSHSMHGDASVAWMTSSETFVDIYSDKLAN
jgi:hypothetical protein